MPHLFSNLGQCRTLRCDTRVPFPPNGSLKGALELRLAGVRIWQVFRQILRRFLVAFLRDDHMGFAKVGARLSIYSCNLLYHVRFWWGLAGTLSSPCTLWNAKVMKGKTKQVTRRKHTQPGKDMSTSRGASSCTSRRLVSSNS